MFEVGTGGRGESCGNDTSALSEHHFCGLEGRLSPVTPADCAAHEAILTVFKGIKGIKPRLISEALDEGGDVVARRYGSIDPLHGSKEYVARSGAFVVNVALVEDGRVGARGCAGAGYR